MSPVTVDFIVRSQPVAIDDITADAQLYLCDMSRSPATQCMMVNIG